jgi:5-methylcytosine-specific restriction endonuclease McrA
VPELYVRKPNTTCCVCDKLIYKRPSEIKATKNKLFCSSACYGVSCRKEVSCIVCGKPILSGLNKKTCSRVCANKNRAGIYYLMQGPNDKAKGIRSIKKQLFDLRGPQCERCLYAIHQVLHVHHKNRNRKDNSFENLELLCPNCHYSEHYAA